MQESFIDFPYHELDEQEPCDPAMERMAHALAEVFTWQVRPDESDLQTPIARTVGLRTIAAIWVVRPCALGNQSLNQLAQRLGCSAAILSRYAGEFRDLYRIKGRGQRSNGTRWRMREAHKQLPGAPADPSRN